MVLLWPAVGRQVARRRIGRQPVAVERGGRDGGAEAAFRLLVKRGHRVADGKHVRRGAVLPGRARPFRRTAVPIEAAAQHHVEVAAETIHVYGGGGNKCHRK